MSRLAALFDAMSGLPSDERERALADLAAEDPALAATLRELLEVDADQLAIPEPPNAEALLQRLTAGSMAGDFSLVRLLGRGGMGEVWEGVRIQEGIVQRAAVKLLRPDRQEPELLKRFVDEQRIVAQLNHRNIVRLIELGQLHDGTSWLAMDLVEGEPLLAYCDRRCLSLRRRVELLIRVLEAVQHAHQQLIVHRDLKSEHVLVDATGEPRLLDFGIARRLDGMASTAPTVGFFSACNVTPEQLLGQPISVATDVYQLGLLLYRLVSGREAQAREGVSPSILQQRVLERSPPAPSDALDAAAAAQRGASLEALRRELRGDLDRIVLHALRAAPGERYPTALAFRDDLRAWLDCRPVQAVGQGRAYRTWKLLQRHRLVVAVAGIATLLLCGAALALLRQELALARAHRDAVVARDAAEMESARAVQVRDLLLDLFRAADPALDGVPGEAARIEDAVSALERRKGLADVPELTLALAEAAIGLGQHERSRTLLDELGRSAERLPIGARRHRLLLLARLAVATQQRQDLIEHLRAVAPLMADAGPTEQAQYLRLLGGVLLPDDPARVLRLTDLAPVPPTLIRLRARAHLQLGQFEEAERLLGDALDRTDVSRLQRLGLLQVLVTTMVDTQRFTEAEATSRRLIDEARPLLGADSRAMLGYWNTRAIALAAVGRADEAVQVLDAQLDRPDLTEGVRRSLELNRVLFGSAVPVPDTRTRAWLDRRWPDRRDLGRIGYRALLLAKVRLAARDGRPADVRRHLAASAEVLDGTDLEARLLRQWALAVDPASRDDAMPAGLATMLPQVDPHLAAFMAAHPDGLVAVGR